MKKLLAGLILGFAAQVAMATAVVNPYSIMVVPWLAPNVFGSPSWGAAEANAVQGIYNGTASYGAAGPAQFNAQTGPVSASDVIVTGFNSWRGQINPGTAFGPAYAAELGNRMTFGVLIEGSGGNQFSISQLAFNAVSTDPFNALGFGFAAGGYNYGSGYMGILYGADGVLGGGDDTFITSGPNTQLVDALAGRGSGNSFAAYCTGICDAADQLAALADVASYPGEPFEFTGTYSLIDNGRVISSGEGTFTINPVSEPGSLALLGLAMVGAVGVTRRKKV